MKRRRFRLAAIATATVLLVAGYFAYPFIEIARPWFNVVGVDVSHHQGDVDWKKLAQSGVTFAYMKSTEGGDYVDPKFRDNWSGAKQAGLAVGAYHFFTQCKSGAEQAKNFLAHLPQEAGVLPPVIDAEQMEACKDPTIHFDQPAEIVSFLETVAATTGCRPIIYETPEFEFAYLRGAFLTEHFWVRSIFFPPFFRKDSWVFWQYHNAGARPGVNTPVDLNVFRGNAADFDAFRHSAKCFASPS